MQVFASVARPGDRLHNFSLRGEIDYERGLPKYILECMFMSIHVGKRVICCMFSSIRCNIVS